MRRGRQHHSSGPQLPHTFRSLAAVVDIARAHLSASHAGDINAICDRVKHEATAAEWLLWGDQHVKDGVRAALRAKSTGGRPRAVNINGEYRDPEQLEFSDFVQWAYARAIDGREMDDRVREIAQYCLQQTGRTFDPDVVISAAEAGEAVEDLIVRLSA